MVAFAAMEGVSYASHRWLMHGPGMVWHASHHRPPAGPVERNDLFPLCFSVVGFALFALGTAGPAWTPLVWVGAGVTAYGAVYLFVHEVAIHGRFPVPVPRWRYLAWLCSAHRVHHVTGGEPYGMLLPLRPGPAERRAALEAAPEMLDRSARARSTRSARSRL